MALNFLKVRNGLTLKPNTAPSVPENGDIYYDSGSNTVQFYQNGAWVSIPNSIVSTVGTFDSQTPDANGLVISGANIYAQSASATVPGMVNNTTQTMSGAKTFSTSIASPSHIINGSSSGAITMSAGASPTSYSLVWPSAQAPASGYILSNDGSGNLSWVNAPTIVPKWTQIILTFASFSTASTTNDISLIVLPARTMLHQVVIKHSAPASGSGLTAYTLSVGLATNFTAFTQPFDVKQAVSQTGKSITQIDDIPNFASTQDIRIQAISAGTNLNGLTAGTFNVWVLTSTLP